MVSPTVYCVDLEMGILVVKYCTTVICRVINAILTVTNIVELIKDDGV